MRRKAAFLYSHFVRCLLVLGLSFAGAKTVAAGSDFLLGPTLGFLFDAGTGSLRPIVGIPGAARVGQPIPLLDRIENASISPGQDYALTWKSHVSVRSPQSGLQLVRFDTATPVTRDLGIDGAVTKVDFSPSGAAAVIWESDSLQVISGLPGSPVSGSRIQLQWGGQEPGTVAVRDDGTALLAGFSNGGNGSLALWSSASGLRFIATVGHPTAIAFDSQGKDALIADAESNQVILIKDVEGGAASVVVAGENQGIRLPQSVAFDSADQLAISLNQNGEIVVASLTQNWSRLVVPTFVPGGLYRLKGSSVFRLTDNIFQPIWCIAFTQTQNRMFFVPAALPLPKKRPQE